MLVVETLPTGHRVWISEHGYIEVQPLDGVEWKLGRVQNPLMYVEFEDVDPRVVFASFNGEVVIEDPDERVVSYDSDEWIAVVRDFVMTQLATVP